MVHFLFYAGKAYGYKKDGVSDPIGEAMQDGFRQEMTDPMYSAYSYEDLPSDRYGAMFATQHFDSKSEDSLGMQIANYLRNVLGAVDPECAPNYSSLPSSDSKNYPTKVNMTTKPFFTNEQ